MRAELRAKWQKTQGCGRRNIGGIPKAFEDVILGHLPPSPCRVADLAAGDGWFAALMRSKGYDAVAYDLHGDDVSAAAGVVVRDAEEPFPTELHGTFGIVAILDAIEHVVDDVQILDNAHDLLAPGGTLLLTTKSGPTDEDSHLRHYDQASLERLLNLTGFSVQQIVVNEGKYPYIRAVRAASYDAALSEPSA